MSDLPQRLQPMCKSLSALKAEAPDFQLPRWPGRPPHSGHDLPPLRARDLSRPWSGHGDGPGIQDSHICLRETRRPSKPP